jgi:hypothetical protein
VDIGPEREPLIAGGHIEAAPLVGGGRRADCRTRTAGLL